MKRMKRTSVGVLDRVVALAQNLWWTWNTDAQRLFAALDPVLWDATNHNPTEVLARLSPERRAALAEDQAFITHLGGCERALRDYLRTKTWFARTAKGTEDKQDIAMALAAGTKR